MAHRSKRPRPDRVAADHVYHCQGSLMAKPIQTANKPMELWGPAIAVLLVDRSILEKTSENQVHLHP